MDAKKVNRKTFGMMAGVFTPTVLTILGVIMYIRHSWVVGNAGVLGAVAIIVLAVAITLTTALSLSSITTNVRIGAGGAFSLISQSLGLEIGGAIGIPFYFSQAIAVAMYVFGFREGLATMFPMIDPFIMDLGIFLLVIGIAFISTGFAFKIQYFILAIVVASLVCIYGALFVNPLHYKFEWFGKYTGSPGNEFSQNSFWVVFAVFFPAVTGVMAGANMSGDLTNPRKSIPTGTISAVIITTIIYISLVFVAGLLATPEELVSNYNIFIDKSLFPPIVLAGLLGATLSSALGSFVGAPRILLALGQKQIVPKSDFLSKTSKKGEPYNAMYVTAAVVLLGLSMRSLNAIAPLITMFFMITYGMVNVVALIEQSLGLPSFRPSLKIPIWVPLIGALGSLTVMFIINAFVALVSLILIVVFYFYLVKKQIKSDAADSRSGLFTALAEWATKKTNELSPKKEARSWRPDLLIPITAPREIRSSFKLIESIVRPKGSIKLLAVPENNVAEEARLMNFIPDVVKKFKEITVPISFTKIKGDDFSHSLSISMQALNAAFFKPNTLFISLDTHPERYMKYESILSMGANFNYGTIVYAPFGNTGLAMENNINLWITRLPIQWQERFDVGNNDLSILISLLIARNWRGNINMMVVNKSMAEKVTKEDVAKLAEIIRLPKNSICSIVEESLEEELSKAKLADLNIFSLDKDLTFVQMAEMAEQTRISALFCADSGFENAFV